MSNYGYSKSFSLNNATLLNVDFVNKKILTYKDYVLNVYSLTDGTLLNSIPSYSGAYLLNNYILSSTSQLNLSYQ